MPQHLQHIRDFLDAIDDARDSIATMLETKLYAWGPVLVKLRGLEPTGPKGKRLNPRTFQRRLITLAIAAGIRKDVHPHLMRHNCATQLLETGAPLTDVQEFARACESSNNCNPQKLKPAVDRL